MKKYLLVNILDNVIIGLFTESEFINKVRNIAVENDDEELSIIKLGESLDYLTNYCPNIELRIMTFGVEDIRKVAWDLNFGEITDEHVNYVLLNYNEEDDPTSLWYEIVEQQLYSFEPTEEFEFYVDEKVTTWKRTHFNIISKDLKSAKEKAISFYKEDRTDDLPWIDVEGVEEKMTIEDNDDEATAELYYNNEFIYKNTNK